VAGVSVTRRHLGHEDIANQSGQSVEGADVFDGMRSRPTGSGRSPPRGTEVLGDLNGDIEDHRHLAAGPQPVALTFGRLQIGSADAHHRVALSPNPNSALLACE
jgi:hypothetical protein